MSHPLITAAPGPLDLLYRDDALIVVQKPSGLACHRGLANARGDYVLTRVRDQVRRPVFLVHRLDRATSGAIALVLDARFVAPLARAFQDGRVHKRYVALARGVLPPYVSVDYPLPRNLVRGAERFPAQTELFLRGVYADRYSLVQAVPRTGRYHQIRRHLKHLHHPIIGDTTHGDGKENRLFRERFGLMRLALHASVLHLPHPVSGDLLELCAPLPPDLAAPLAAMGFVLEPVADPPQVGPSGAAIENAHTPPAACAREPADG